MAKWIKVGVAQTDPKLAQLEHNMETTRRFVQEAAAQGCLLVVFPECSLTGYCYSREKDVIDNALTVGSLWTTDLELLARQNDLYFVVGFVESSGGKYYNSVALIGPEGIVDTYRKVHLSNLGVDNFVSPGDHELVPIETPIGKLGIMICYDVRFPEHSRVLALQGADILIHSTNLPITAKTQVDYLLPTRAVENHIYVLSSNRVGMENEFRFIGLSTIFGLNGEAIAQADSESETLLVAELDLEKVNNKKVFFPAMEGKPVHHYNDLFGARRPNLYRKLTEE
ncbi:MAG: carbon-nitrogen hydrolase family protein [Dethiobacter sp.]|jgi:predicted amidohydrolase|nr:carbon-nitrogen hydrolase family protein [Dethiobacter sp.]